MNIQEDPVAIVSSSCRLPGGILQPSQLWSTFCDPGRVCFSASSCSPLSRCVGSREPLDKSKIGGAAWLGEEGIEAFDPAFFNITPAEADTLRPNTRLALELTWEALERAGICPSSLRGKNVSISIGVGTEDGWDMRRFSEDGFGAFDHHWAANSDPSGVAGNVAHFFDFHGPSSVISTACSSGAFALRDGIASLFNENCEIAIVGAVTTHFFPAPFHWAASVNVASKKGQCSAFSDEADGYVPSEGAVFFVLKKSSVAQANGNPILGLIRSVTTGHNGSTRALATPNVLAQAVLTRRSLRAAGVNPYDIDILEAHATGTRLGDAMEAEAIRSVYDKDKHRQFPLWLSASKVTFGHCQAASALVGILKVLACFEKRCLPSHHVIPLPEFGKGQIMIPTEITPLLVNRPLIAQTCSFGFTGSIASVILEEAPRPPASSPSDVARSTQLKYLLSFSAKTTSALDAQIRSVYEWALETSCSMYDLGALLSLSRDHHIVRLGVIASDVHELQGLSTEAGFAIRNSDTDCNSDQGVPSDLLDLSHIPSTVSEEDRQLLDIFLSSKQNLKAACLLYSLGHDLHFDEIYDLKKVSNLQSLLQTFPSYCFDRKLCWKIISAPGSQLAEPQYVSNPADRSRAPPNHPSIDQLAQIIGSILHIPTRVPHNANIFDLGIDSLNSIELASTVTQTFGVQISAIDLYSLLTVSAIHDFLNQGFGSKRSASVPYNKPFSQIDVDLWIGKYGAPLDAPPTSADRNGNQNGKCSSAMTILLTGANGMLGCHLLRVLLSNHKVHQIFCPVRGDAWTRLTAAYARHGHDPQQLLEERGTSRLVVFHVSDLGDDMLGSSEDIYHQLTQGVDNIVHLAWKLDFNLSAPGFQNCIQATRNLAQLCALAKKEVAYYFISSFSAYFGFDGPLIPEKPLSPNLNFCLDQGYAVSKLIAEHALLSMLKHDPTLFRLRVVRIAQICGNSITGEWAPDEMMPMIIKSASVLHAVPQNMPDVSWIPSDICATSIVDLILSSSPGSLQIFHLANAHICPWPSIVGTIAQLAGLGNISLVSDREYVELIGKNRAQVPSLSRLLPYFSSVLEKSGFPTRFCSLEVKNTLNFSPALAGCPVVDAAFLKPIITKLLGKSQEYRRRDPLPQPVLLFGPWSKSAFSVAGSKLTSTQIKSQVESAVTMTREKIDYIDENQSLDYQVETLIAQLSAFDRLSENHVTPRAVLGYCFGEYAASVAAGIRTVESVVEIIVRRAAALGKVEGSMLNVFSEHSRVKRLLLKLPSPPDIAIFAGPNHFVLSGSHSQISNAQALFQTEGIKTKLVETSLPFHSSVMDGPISYLVLPSVECKNGTCIYISGLTGRPVGGTRLGPKYWLRHMRDPVLFSDAVSYIQSHFASNPLLDLGPGGALTSIISRYTRGICKIYSLDSFFTSDLASIPLLPEFPIPSQQSEAPHVLDYVPLIEEPTSAGNRTSTDAAIVDILSSSFGFEGSRDLLSRSFMMLGLQSLAFVSFSDKVQAATGLKIPASSFTSDSSLRDIIGSLEIQ